MRAVREFNVVPAIPPALADLSELAYNLHWTWDRATQQLFSSLDPAAWKEHHGDPQRLLAAITPQRWAELAADPNAVAATQQAAERLADAKTAPRWFQGRTDSPLDLIAYFSPEFGLSETLPQYSGGLGVLSGDHLKAASDLGLPLVGIGLLYDQGYFRQRLNADGLQEERFPDLDPHGLPIVPTGVDVTVDLAGDPVRLTAWEVNVGRVRLFLLDTNVDGNSLDGHNVTDRLYGGDSEHRIRQEIVLGIGGVRVLRALGLHPQAFHTNEGHAGFLGLERIRELVEQGYTFDQAVEAVRPGCVFTTHTPVPAGIDRFDPALMEKYFGGFATRCGVPFSRLMALGLRPDEPDEQRFNMAVMGLRLAGRSNGVAKLHGKVSREMFAGLWPDTPIDEVPIIAVTNGVHAHTWTDDHVDALLSESVGTVWDGADQPSWNAVTRLDPRAIWDARRSGRAELVSYARARVGDNVLDPDSLTIGFARRFATYKRATLLLGQADRLRALLLDADRPVQFVFAGKAHPADNEGKELIRQIEVFARQVDVGYRFVFLPDYDMGVARRMYHGCDVWLNTPRRPMEACGTSGMKAALNGALNCSVLDGWWDECYDPDTPNGWAITSADDDPDYARRDAREAVSLFGLLEREIVPLFYQRDADGLPLGWIEMIKNNWRTLGPFVTAARMVRDYTTELYEPAAADGRKLTTDDGRRAKELAAFKARVRAAWSDVAIRSIDVSDAPAAEGEQRDVSASIDLGGLTAADVSVQLIHGGVDREGNFVNHPAHVELSERGDGVFAGRYEIGEAGPYGVTVRVLPHNDDFTSPVEMGLITWA